jgi:hypothetical protein
MGKIAQIKGLSAVLVPTQNPMQCTENMDREKRWRAESDLDTLMRAAEVKRDKERFGAAVAIARQRKKDLNSVTDGDDA